MSILTKEESCRVACGASSFASVSIKVLRLLAVCSHVNIDFIVSLMQLVFCIFGTSLWLRQHVWDDSHDDVSLLPRSSEEIVIHFS